MRITIAAVVLALASGSAWAGIGFEPAESLFPEFNVRSVAVGDIDGDGRDDVVFLPIVAATPFAPLQLQVSLQRVDGTLAPPAPVASSLGVVGGRIALADMDGDGRLDIVAGFSRNAASGVTILRNLGSLQFAARSMEGDVVPRELDLVDIDGDGALDALAFYAEQFPLQAYLGDGAGGFRARETLGIIAGRDLRVADVDGDGRPDLLLADRERVRIHRQTGSGFAPVAKLVPLPLRGRAGAIALGDIDADGRLDLAVAMDAGAGREAAVALFPQQPNGSFRAKHLVASPLQPGVLVFDDLDGDGHADLVAPQLSQSHILVYAGLPGTLRDVAAFPTFAPAGRAEVAFGDLDGDGRRDILVARGLQASGLGLSRGRPSVVESDLAIDVALSRSIASIRVQNDGGTTPSSLASIAVELELRGGTLAMGALPSGCGAQVRSDAVIWVNCSHPSPSPGTSLTLPIPLQLAPSPAPGYLSVKARVFAGGTPDVRPGNNRTQRRLTLWPLPPGKRQSDARTQPVVTAPRNAR